MNILVFKKTKNINKFKYPKCGEKINLDFDNIIKLVAIKMIC